MDKNIPYPDSWLQYDSTYRNPKKCYAMPMNHQPNPANFIYRTELMNASWYYHWGEGFPEDNVYGQLPDSIGWSPMIWDFHGNWAKLESQITYLDRLKNLGLVNSLLGFNEPNNSTQANMSVHQAIEAWPKLMSLEVKLGSPATTRPTVQWMKDFMDSVKAHNYRVDFIAVHWYSSPDSAKFINTLQKTFSLYHKPIWITEFAVADWSASTIENNPYTPKQVLAFMQKVLPVLDTLNYVEKYFWHNTPYNKPADWSSAIFDSAYNLTELGKYYSEYQYHGPLPIVPIPISPSFSAINVTRKAAIKWNNSTFGIKYQVQLAKDSATNSDGSFIKNSIIIDTTLIDTIVQLNQPLDSSKIYYWHVRAIDMNGKSSYTTTFNFKTGTTIAPPLIPQPFSPPKYVTGVSRIPLLKWKSSLYAINYEFQVANDYHIYDNADSVGAFLRQNVVLDTTLEDTSFQLSSPLDSLTRYYWHVRAINPSGTSEYSNSPLFYFTTGASVTSVKKEDGEIPSKFKLYQNYPNPFNPSTIINYQIPNSGFVTLNVYDVLGKEVATLVNEVKSAGEYTVQFNTNGKQLSSGIYFYKIDVRSKMTNKDLVKVCKMIFLK